VSWYQKGKTNLDFTEARDGELQWHLLGHMQVCTLLQSDNHASTTAATYWTRRAEPNNVGESNVGTVKPDYSQTLGVIGVVEYATM